MTGPPDTSFSMESPTAERGIGTEPNLASPESLTAHTQPAEAKTDEKPVATDAAHKRPRDDYDEDAAVRELIANMEINDKAPAIAFGLAPPQGWPMNVSVFPRNPITFDYDHEKYQGNFAYRWWVTERVLGLTRKTTYPEWGQELEHRNANHKRIVGFADPEPPFDRTTENMTDWRRRVFLNRQINAKFEADNAKVTPQTSGWTLDPGPEGVPLHEYPRPVPRLPELIPQIAGLLLPNPVMEEESLLYPSSRSWSTEEELRLFPLGLHQVHPGEFIHAPVSPEILFVDRLGVTMKGVSQTPQCTERKEHMFSKCGFVESTGYDFNHASHGITYEDYRRMIAGSIAIIERNGVNLNRAKARAELKQFFYAVSDSLRARGVPVVVKFKSPTSNEHQEPWENHGIFMTHLTLDRKMRRKMG